MVHLTNDEFAQKFIDSQRGEEIRRKLQEPPAGVSLKDKPGLSQKYANSALQSIKMVIRRELLIWWRDKTKRIARLIQCLIMGVIVGTVFWQSDNAQTRMGVNFQSIFFISLGAMLKVPVSAPSVPKLLLDFVNVVSSPKLGPPFNHCSHISTLVQCSTKNRMQTFIQPGHLFWGEPCL